jgi:cytochrome oxidase Cu insertion factor (SCO1/SenC/PrrC family)
MRPIFLAATLLILGSACGAEGSSSRNAAAASSKQFGAVPEAQFTDLDRNEASPAQLKGSVWALSLISTSLVAPNFEFMGRLVQVQEILAGSDTRLVSVSVDPLGDTPEDLARLAERFGVDTSSWSFWIGSEGETARFIHGAYRSSLVDVDPEQLSLAMRMAFESNVVAIDRAGQVRGTYDLASEDGAGLLVERLRQLEQE